MEMMKKVSYELVRVTRKVCPTPGEKASYCRMARLPSCKPIPASASLLRLTLHNMVLEAMAA